GLFGTLGTRSMVKMTSCAVKGVPSANFTPLRRLKVQVSPSTVQDSAREGTGLATASVRTSGSNKGSDSCVFGVGEGKCGSMDVGSDRNAMTRSRASTAAVKQRLAASAVKARVLRMDFMFWLPLFVDGIGWRGPKTT